MSEPQDLSAIGWPLRTERLLLRPLTADDLEPTWAYRRLPEVGEWIGGAPADLTAYAGWFDGAVRQRTTLAIEHDGTVVGDLMLRLGDGYAQAEVAEVARGVEAELGWVLDPAHAGRGLATEAVAGLVDACFGPLGLRRVTAACFALNEPSWRLMERLGMRRETVALAESLHRARGWLDSYAYALLATEWAERRQPRPRSRESSPGDGGSPS